MPDAKPRILVFSLAYLPFMGGAEFAIKEVADRIGDRFDFNLICYRFDSSWPRTEKIGNINIYRVGQGKDTKEYYGRAAAKALYVLEAARLARRLHKEKHYSLIWGMMAAYAGMAALFFKWLNPRVPFLLTLQEGDPEERILKRVGPYYPLWKKIFRKADYIQAISKYLADFGRRHGAKCPVEVVPNGVDVSIFTREYPADELQRLRGVLGMAPQDKVVITTSRLVPKNSVDILIKSTAEVKKSLPNIKCLILGIGKDEAALKNLTRKLGLEKEVFFLGNVLHGDMAKYLKISDVFVRASRSEGLGNSFLEAMAAGLPVIGTNVGGIPDFLRDGETGLFVRVEDEKDLAEKILLLLRDESLRQKLIRQGKEMAIRDYSWDEVARRMEIIFSRLCKG
ncbi:MAG: glycosyltransferase family 4 protein [Candidatus Sungbacteria bacterium]|nr:glycosyltransferase family 4 protein [Candidatus Sungbacteria bacterium]